MILKMSSNSSKGHQSPRSPQRSTKGIQGDLNSSKRYQRPQNPVVVKSSSNGHQMVLTKSSKVPKNSPQMVHKKSAKGPEKFFNVLRYSGPQVFKKSSKRPQSPQKVKKMHKKVPNVLRPQVLKRYSNRPQSPQKFINVLNSSVGSQVREILNVLKSPLNPQTPQVHNRSTRSNQKFLKASSMFWEHQSSGLQKVLKKSQSPQKVMKMHKRYPRSSDLRFSTDPQSVLKFLKCSLKPSKSSEDHKR